jgi:hypothetical protein
MPNLKKIILTGLAVILVVGAAPAAAQVAGTWAGEGTGSCSPPSGILLHPWQNWKGEIPNTEDVFTGEWWDADGNQGSFFGKLAPFSTPDTKIYQGLWTLDDPSGFSCIGGKFTMLFYYLEDECEGTWNSVWPSGLPCKMWGKKVD